MGESLPRPDYLSSVEESDHGAYTCTRSYVYHGQTYNMTFTLVLDVQPNSKTRVLGIFSLYAQLFQCLKCLLFCCVEKYGKSVILSPHGNDVFHVDLGEFYIIM